MIVRNAIARSIVITRCFNNVLRLNRSSIQAVQSPRFIASGPSEPSAKIAVGQSDPVPTDKQMVSWIYDHIARCDRSTFTEDDIKSKVLEPRTMDFSYRRFIIPLSSDQEKRNEYLSANGNIRTGKILEDLDHMAVYVGFVHNSENGILTSNMTLPRSIVTASVQRIDFHREDINPTRDVIIDGQVTYAGTSSMQISIRLFQNDDNGNLVQMLKAHFIMVSRDPTDASRKVRVHGLIAKTPEEAETINRAKEELKIAGSSEERQPTNEELRLIHNLYNNLIERNAHNDTPVLKNDEMWMHKSKLSVTEICFPEYQNMYGKIFGGFLMRKALELAHTNAKLLCKSHVMLRSMDHIEFTKAVEIGHVLHLDSMVTYTDGKYVQIRVDASVSDQRRMSELGEESNPSLGQEARINTNVFNFTLESGANNEVMKIVPKHYVHAGSYIEGRRLLRKTLKRIVN